MRLEVVVYCLSYLKCNLTKLRIKYSYIYLDKSIYLQLIKTINFSFFYWKTVLFPPIYVINSNIDVIFAYVTIINIIYIPDTIRYLIIRWLLFAHFINEGFNKYNNKNVIKIRKWYIIALVYCIRKLFLRL